MRARSPERQLGETAGNDLPGGGDPRAFQDLLAKLGVAPALFLPPEISQWEGSRLRLNRHAKPPSEISGVRLYAADPKQPGSTRERDVQTDAADLVQGISKLRQTPGWESVVLSNESFRGRQLGHDGMRVRFGLARDEEGEKDDKLAARRCHRRIERAFSRAGFRILHPERFDSGTGMKGLESWAASVRLAPKWRPGPLLWLLLLPLLLLIPWRCSSPPPFGVPIRTDFILIVDHSGSMDAFLENVRTEARRLIAEKGRWDKADLIFFAGTARPVFGELRPLNQQNSLELNRELSLIKSEDSTNLTFAMELAAAEIVKHGRPTTLLLLTDGVAKGLDEMAANPDELRRKFGGVPVVIHAIAPRFLSSKKAEPAIAQGSAEEALATLCKAFGGKFGPAPAAKPAL
ncbi:MAG: hypothetical protein JWL59_2487 [Chthoniobacteraceae bacterium]|nr:hypothetical protein [Chthoniobacteraceae bacterium]